ncbi:MAG: NTP transferase domain-containing protein [Candidatus Lambdaproteobacteria bacterium]|nr:NTP transferase domain-containing protein [Candidatus Lambdaproteobacteria bacterium]
MKAVILAAGPSERLHPFTETRSKPMIHVAGKPMLENMANALAAAGITEILIVVNHAQEILKNHFEHGHRFGLSIDYIYQEPLDGIGGALRRCERHLRAGPFFLVYGDILTSGDPFSQVLSRYTESGGAVAALSLPANSREFGNVYLNENMLITKFVEKPADPHLSNYVFAGIFLLSPNVFETLDKTGNDIEKTYQTLIEARALSGTLWDGGWIDISRPWHILEANRMLMQDWREARIHQSVKLEGNVQIEGAVHIEENVVIGSGTLLKGPCYIGSDSYIGNNVLIREFTALGPRSVVGYGTELKNCVLFGRSTLGRLSFIGDSVIGERVDLGTGVTTVNIHHDRHPIEMDTPDGRILTGMDKLGAFIGDDVVIGARNALGPGTRIKAKAVVPDLITLNSIQ